MANERKFKVGDCVKTKTSERKMIIDRIIGDKAFCVWTYKKRQIEIFSLIDLIHTKSNSGIIILRNSH
jgi:hypothetical protein